MAVTNGTKTLSTLEEVTKELMRSKIICLGSGIAFCAGLWGLIAEANNIGQLGLIKRTWVKFQK